MRGSIKWDWGATAISLGLALGLTSPAFGQRNGIVHHYMEDDKIPWGPEGTIGRGTDDPPEVWEVLKAEGLSYRTINIPAVPARPYPTTLFYEPGDGYRYQLYYSPSTRTYFYYPVVR